MLIGDDVQLFAFLGQSQHRLGKITAARCKYPARAQDQMVCAGSAHAFFASALGTPIHRQRIRGIVLDIRCRLAAIEHVVGGIVHHPGAMCACFFGEHAGCRGVDAVRAVGVRFGFVDGSIGRGIDDHIGAKFPHPLPQGVEVFKIDIRAAKRTQLAEHGQGTLEFPTHLAVFTEEQNLHAAYCLSSHSR
jgi:hypothetical protein